MSRRCHVTIVVWEKQYVLRGRNVVFSLIYPTCTALALCYIVICDLSDSIMFFHSVILSSVTCPTLSCFSTLLYCHLWPVWLYHVFPLYYIVICDLSESIMFFHSVILSSVTCPTLSCFSTLLYCHLWPVRLYQVFPLYYIVVCDLSDSIMFFHSFIWVLSSVTCPTLSCFSTQLYCHLWPVRLYYYIFPHYLINDWIFVKKEEVIEYETIHYMNFMYLGPYIVTRI